MRDTRSISGFLEAELAKGRKDLSMRHSVFVVMFTGALVIGCASPRPFTMTCSTMRLSAATEARQPVDMGNFSVAAPESDVWCLAPREPDQVMFWTHPLMGQYIEKPERKMTSNTMLMQAVRVKHGAASLRNIDELQQFVEEWIKRGFGINYSGSEPIVGDTVEPRFTLVSSSVKPWRVLDADCVRVKYVKEERGNPHAPNKVLILIVDGPICHHPTARDYLVVIGISERYERGKQIDPNVFDRLKSEYAESFFKSLEFAPAD